MAWKLADFTNPASFAVKLRRKRFQHFLDMVRKLPRPVRVLDVGGAEYFWRVMGVDLQHDFHVTLLNIAPVRVASPHLSAVVGDARNLSRFADGAFDVVFSNSVIEHVGDLADQQKMADEVRRVGKYYYLQTPNRNFPIEPHFQFPLFQFLPRSLRIAVVRRWSIGWYPRAKDLCQAKDWIDEIRLMTKQEVRRLFPQAIILPERFAGLVKSWIAVYGPNQQGP